MQTPSDRPSSQSNNNRLQPLVALRALRKLINDPEDTRQVFVVLQSLSGNALERSFRRFRNTPVAQRVLQEPGALIDRLRDREWLATLPAGTLGRTYLEFVQTEQITADGLVEASDAEDRIDDPQLRKFGERMRDMHDLWHVTTGYGRDTFGEVCLLGFTFAQTKNPGIAAIALMGAHKTGQELGKGVWGALWRAFKDGRRASWLPAEDWEERLTQPIGQVRHQLRLTTPEAYQSVSARAQAQAQPA